MRIAVLGGGNGSYAAAADLAEQGHQVRLWRRDRAELQPLIEAGAITVKDSRGTRSVPVGRATHDIGEALSGAELIVAPVPAFGQIDLARRMAPHLGSGQVVFLAPGTFGSYAMAAAVKEAGGSCGALFAETGTLPYLARKHGPAEVAITTRATRLPTGVFPAKATEAALHVVARAYPAVEHAEDALSGALLNAGPIIHPPLITMNAAPIEHFDRWDIHNEGTQPSVRRVTTALDNERIAVRKALGYQSPHFPLSDHYTPGGEEWMYGNLAHDKLVDSGDWREALDLTRHRYMREDVAYGLAFLVSVADWAGVPCPVARGLLSIAEAVLGESLDNGPRTLRTLGLASLSPAAMRHLLQDGLA
jgi:opine dehydrogenase